MTIADSPQPLVTPCQIDTHVDPKSGVTVKRYATPARHSNHCYFDVDGSWNDGQEIVISRDTDQGTGLFSLRLSDGHCRALSNSQQACVTNPTGVSVSDKRMTAYFWSADELWVSDLRSGTCQLLTRLPDGFVGSNTAITCDHQYLTTIITQRHHSSAEPETTEQRVARTREGRLSQMVLINLDNGELTILHQSSEHLLGHANPSPTDPDLFTFCHEGPWLEIDQRIWGLRRSDPNPWPIVPKDPKWGVGHEFWFADGQTLGYHARYCEGTWRHALGWASADGKEAMQAEIAVPTHHAHAWTRDHYILDGTRESGDYVMIVSPEGEGWSQPRILCCHNTSRWHNRAHVHQHVCKDGKTVIFTSDRKEYCDVYLVEIPDDLEQLPLYDGKPYRFYWE